jgi:hypothetical protein
MRRSIVRFGQFFTGYSEIRERRFKSNALKRIRAQVVRMPGTRLRRATDACDFVEIHFDIPTFYVAWPTQIGMIIDELPSGRLVSATLPPWQTLSRSTALSNSHGLGSWKGWIR